LIRDERGRPRSVLSIESNITAQRERELEMFRAERIESIGTLAGGIAHDLNNILAPIVMGAGLLKQKELDASSQRIIDTIESSVARASKLVRQILSFTRGGEGQRSLVHVGAIVRGVVEIAEQTFPKNISLRVAVPEGIPFIRGDQTQLEQVLLNICVNARDAMKNGGTLTIGAETIGPDAPETMKPGGLPDRRYVVLRVVDTGTGIPPEIIDRIFDPFFTTKERGHGTGLGLSTSALIVQRLGGAIRVESRLGSGTVFRIYLPASHETAVTVQPSDEDTASLRGNGETILLVDDEPAILAVTQSVLEEFNYRVLTASNGAEAVGTFAVRKNDVRLVITDMMMPVMDGIATVTALRQIKPDIAVIGMSGIETYLESGPAKEAGVRSLIAKPFTATALLKMVRATLELTRRA
jgi:nitrogen-specific signal transduction histidine kinase/CheY-like chemotaxis protein